MNGPLVAVPALLFAPFCLIYCAIKLREDVARSRWPMIVLGVLSVLHAAAAIAFFWFLWEIVEAGGL